MRQQCAIAPQLNPRHHEKVRRGLKGSASATVTDTQTPAVLFKHFIQRLGEGRLWKSTLSTVLRRVDLKKKRRMRVRSRLGPPPPAAGAVGSDSDSHHPDQQSNACFVWSVIIAGPPAQHKWCGLSAHSNTLPYRSPRR